MYTTKIKRKSKTPIILADGGSIFSDMNRLSTGISSGVDLVNNIVGLTKIADTTELSNAIKQQSNISPTASTNDQLMSQWASQSNLGNVSFKDVGGKNLGQLAGGVFKGAASGALAGTAIMPGIGTAIGGAVGYLGSLVGGLVGRNKAKNKQAALNKKTAEANANVFNAFSNKAQSLDKSNDSLLASNYFGDGGGLHTQGTYFTNDVNTIQNGGTHEQNPNGGVQISVDPEGAPNLVEQDEVKYKDYIFSNRLSPSEKVLKDLGLKSKYKNYTFAKIAENFSKESKERPNDPISKDGLEAMMSKLVLAQESIKNMKQSKTKNNKFAKGGPLNVEDPLKKGIDTLSKAKYINPYDTNYGINKYATVDNPLLRGIDTANTAKYINPYNTSWSINKYATVDNPLLRGINSLNNPSNQENIIASAHGNNKSRASWAENLRYAPVLGSGISVLTDLLGVTNKPDYSRIDSIQAETVTPKPVGNYLKYRPLDRDYYQNKLNAITAGTRSGIINQSGGNRAFATAGLIASDYNALNQTGDMARRAEEFNAQQEQQVESFNRGTNIFNSQQALQSDLHNAEQSLRTKLYRTQMAEDLEARTNAAKSANLTNFFDNIGEVGREAFARNMIVTNPALYYTIDSRGNITYKNTESLTSDQFKQVQASAEKEASKKKNTYKKGGLTFTRGL